jgi:hypothetical protein
MLSNLLRHVPRSLAGARRAKTPTRAGGASLAPIDAPIDAPTRESSDGTGVHEPLIGAIIEINPGAGRAFLRSFEVRQLESYLEHLRSGQTPRGRGARWVRSGETSAACACVCAD